MLERIDLPLNRVPKDLLTTGTEKTDRSGAIHRESPVKMIAVEFLVPTPENDSTDLVVRSRNKMEFQMMKKTFTLLLALIAFQAVPARADLLPNPSIPIAPQNPGIMMDRRASTNWDQGSPTLILATRGCSSPNLCTGVYSTYVPGYTGMAKVGSGTAFCNALPNGVCPNVAECISDMNVAANLNPPVGSGTILPGAMPQPGFTPLAYPGR